MKGGVTTLDRHLFTTHVCVSVYAEYECVDGTGYYEEQSEGERSEIHRLIGTTPVVDPLKLHIFNASTQLQRLQRALNKTQCLLESTGNMDHNQHSKEEYVLFTTSLT